MSCLKVNYCNLYLGNSVSLIKRASTTPARLYQPDALSRLQTRRASSTFWLTNCERHLHIQTLARPFEEQRSGDQVIFHKNRLNNSWEQSRMGRLTRNGPSWGGVLLGRGGSTTKAWWMCFAAALFVSWSLEIWGYKTHSARKKKMKTQTAAIRDSIGGAIDVHKCHCSTKSLCVCVCLRVWDLSQFRHRLSLV